MLGERSWEARVQTCCLSPSGLARHTHPSFHFHTSLRKSALLSSCLLTPRSFHSCFSTTAYSKMRGQRIRSLWGKKSLPQEKGRLAKDILGSQSLHDLSQGPTAPDPHASGACERKTLMGIHGLTCSFSLIPSQFLFLLQELKQPHSPLTSAREHPVWPRSAHAQCAGSL